MAIIDKMGTQDVNVVWGPDLLVVQEELVLPEMMEDKELMAVIGMPPIIHRDQMDYPQDVVELEAIPGMDRDAAWVVFLVIHNAIIFNPANQE